MIHRHRNPLQMKQYTRLFSFVWIWFEKTKWLETIREHAATNMNTISMYVKSKDTHFG